MSSRYIDALDVSVADSWVVPSNKTGTGNGEAKVYVGQKTSIFYREFFGRTGFRLRCRFRKSDLLRFIDEMKSEYQFPTFPYRDSQRLSELWVERRAMIEALEGEYIGFSVKEQSQLDGPRGYINSDDDIYQILRTLPLPGTSILKIIKLEEDDGLVYEFRLMPDFEGSTRRSIEYEILTTGESNPGDGDWRGRIPSATTVERLRKARIGQQKFKRGVLKQNGAICAFTGVTDEGLLIAGHIKPWSKSRDVEKLDPQNGLLFTPTYDRLFDNGLISFTDSRKLLISPAVSAETRTKLRISHNMEVDVPLLGIRNARRREYMDYHREFEFRK